MSSDMHDPEEEELMKQAFEEPFDSEPMEVIDPPLSDEHVREAIESIADPSDKEIDVDEVVRSLAQQANQSFSDDEEILDLGENIAIDENSKPEEAVEINPDKESHEEVTKTEIKEDATPISMAESSSLPQSPRSRSVSPRAASSITKNDSPDRNVKSRSPSPMVCSPKPKSRSSSPVGSHKSRSKSPKTRSRSSSVDEKRNRSRSSSNENAVGNHSRSSSRDQSPKSRARSSSPEHSRSPNSRKSSKSPAPSKNLSDSDVPLHKKVKNKKASNVYSDNSSDEVTKVKKRDSSSDSSTQRKKVHTKKKKKKSRADQSMDSDSDVEHDRPHKHKKKKKDKKDRSLGKKSKLSKSGDKKKKGSSRTSSRTTSIDTEDVAQGKGLDAKSSSGRKISQYGDITRDIKLLVENGSPKLWLMTEVRTVLNSKNIFTARAQDECLEQLTSRVVVRLKRWTTEEIAEATRRRPQPPVRRSSSPLSRSDSPPANYVMPKTKFNRTELTKPEINKKEHSKKRKHSEESEERRKKHRREEKKKKERSRLHVIEEDESSSQTEIQHVPGLEEAIAKSLLEETVKDEPMDVCIPEMRSGDAPKVITEIISSLDEHDEGNLVMDVPVEDVVEEIRAESPKVETVRKTSSEPSREQSPEPRKVAKKQTESHEKNRKPEIKKEKNKKPEIKKVLPPEPKPAPTFKIPKKITVEQRPVIEPPKKKEPIRKAVPKSRQPVPVVTPPKPTYSEKGQQTDSLACLRNFTGPSVEDLMLLAKTQIRDNPIVLARWSKMPPMSPDEFTKIHTEKFGDKHPKPKISMDAYYKRKQDQRLNDRNRPNDPSKHNREVTDRSRNPNAVADRHRNSESTDKNRNSSESANRNRNSSESGDRNRNSSESSDRSKNSVETSNRHRESAERHNNTPESVDRQRNAPGPNNDTHRRGRSPERKNTPEKRRSPDKRRSPERTRTPEVQSNGEMKASYNDGVVRDKIQQVKARELVNDFRYSQNCQADLHPGTSDGFLKPNIPPSRAHADDDDDDAISLFPGEADAMSVVSMEETLLSRMKPSAENPFARSRFSTIKSETSSTGAAAKPATPPQPVHYTPDSNVHLKPFTTPQAVGSPTMSGRSNNSPVPGGSMSPLISAGLLPTPMVASIAHGFNANPNFQQQQQQQHHHHQQQQQPYINQNVMLSNQQQGGLLPTPPQQASTSSVQQNLMKLAMGNTEIPSLLTLAPQPAPSNQGVDPAKLAEYNKIIDMIENLSRKQSQVKANLKNLKPYQRFDRDELLRQIAMLDKDMVFQRTKLQQVGSVIEQQKRQYEQQVFQQQQLEQQHFEQQKLEQQRLLDLQMKEQEQLLQLKQIEQQQAAQNWNVQSTNATEQNISQQTKGRTPKPIPTPEEIETSKVAMSIVNGLKPQLRKQVAAETNEEKFFIELIDGEQQVPPNFSKGVCFKVLTTVGCPFQQRCKFKHDLVDIRSFMGPMSSLEALRLYLFIRKKNFIYYFDSAFQCLQTILMSYRDARCALIMCYELMWRESSTLPQFWTLAVQTLLFVKDQLGEENETELKKILLYVLNNKECDIQLRNDVARLSEKTFQYIPEVWSEIFKDSNYVMPKDIFDLMILLLINNRTQSWAPMALEILVTPTLEEYWQALSPECTTFLVDLCPNPTVRETLATKCNKKQQSALLLPPPLPPAALMGMEMDDDNTPYSPTDNDDDGKVLLVKEPNQGTLVKLLIGQEHTQEVQHMYQSVCEAIDSYKWTEVVHAVLNFSGLKLPRARCLYSALKDRVVHPSQGFQKIAAAARAIVCPTETDSTRSNSSLDKSTQNLLGAVAINLMLDLKDANFYNDAADIYDELEHMPDVKMTMITSYRDAPITESQILLNAGKICLKTGRESTAFRLFNEHTNLTCSDRVAALDVAETLCHHFLFTNDFKSALHFWDFSIQKKKELCSERGISYELPKYADEMMIAGLKEDNDDLVQLWEAMKGYPQSLSRRTIRAIVIKFSQEIPTITRQAVLAGILNNTYPMQTPLQLPRTAKMRSFWTTEEMKAVIEDFLDRMEYKSSNDRNIEDFNAFIHIEVQSAPPPEGHGKCEAELPYVDCSLAAACERAGDALKSLNPSVMFYQTPNDPKLCINAVSLRYYFRVKSKSNQLS